MQLNNVFFSPCIELELGGSLFPLGRGKGGGVVVADCKMVGFLHI